MVRWETQAKIADGGLLRLERGYHSRHFGGQLFPRRDSNGGLGFGVRGVCLGLL
jgi:hypothetical protein